MTTETTDAELVEMLRAAEPGMSDVALEFWATDRMMWNILAWANARRDAAADDIGGIPERGLIEPAPRRGPNGETLQPNRRELAIEVQRLKDRIRKLEARITKAKDVLS